MQDILIAVPSFAYPTVIAQIKPYLHSKSRLICATKGLEPETGQLLHVVTAQILERSYPFAVLAGPSFAQEVAAGKPTAITLATEDDEFATTFSARLTNPYFRVYTTHDVIGVEICGAVKNILAIVAGVVYGLDLGMNALSAMMTRGLAEMQRLGIAAGGKSSTFMGMAGVGDLILTCTGSLSRNRRFGIGVAEGKSPQQMIEEIGQVVEGLDNLNGVSHLAEHYAVEMPITDQMNQVIYHGLPVEAAIRNLLSRELKTEGG